jgi:enoyl-CoA hydratase/carnithine racemase
MIDVIEHDGIRELRLARPPVNALSPELLSRFRELLETAQNDAVGGIVVSGSDGVFTGGLDIPVLLGLDRAGMEETLELFFGAMAAIAGSPVPIAFAITGHSPAGGAVLSIFADWRVMAEGPFVIGLNEVQVGIPMPEAIAESLARLVGRRQAELLCQSGRLLPAEEARAIGLVDRVVPPAEVVPAATEWCRELAALPRHAMTATRRIVRRDLVETLERLTDRDRAVFVDEWFKPEVQGPLQMLAEQLKRK